MSELSFPESEFQERFRKLTLLMKDADLDALILNRPESVFYVCGYTASWIASWTAEFYGLIVQRDSEPKLICRSLEEKAARQQWTGNPYVYPDHEGPWRGVKEILSPLVGKHARVGIEKRYMNAEQLEKFSKILPNVEFQEAAALMNSIMSRPSPPEADRITRAGEISQRGFEAGLDSVKQGVHLYEVMAEIESSMYKAGQSEQNRSLCLVWAGPTGGAMHTTDLTHRIQLNDLVTIEVWGNYKHYRAAAQGTVYVGTPPEKVVDTYNLVSRMYTAAKNKMKPGETTGAAFEAANAHYRSRFGSDYYRRVGGSMGLSSFMLNIGKNDNNRLEPRMAFLIQPQVNDPLLITVSGTIILNEEGHREICRPLLELRGV